jgi:AraC-like DNA-binding protein
MPWRTEMKTKNICKFPPSPIVSNSLSISCFVNETELETMRQHVILTSNRLFLITQGRGAFYINENPLSCHAGTLIFAFEGEKIYLNSNDTILYMYIDFNGPRADELLRRFSISSLSRIYDGFDGLIPLWQESLARASKKTIDLAAESILLYTFSRLYSEETETGGSIGKIAEITEQGFNDPELSISSIAEEMSYHPKYLSSLFKKRMGIRYSEYLRSVRLKYAVSLFDHGIDSVKNVALLSGFSDPLYFSGVFKKHVGISPKDYIEKKLRSK